MTRIDSDAHNNGPLLAGLDPTRADDTSPTNIDCRHQRANNNCHIKRKRPCRPEDVQQEGENESQERPIKRTRSSRGEGPASPDGHMRRERLHRHQPQRHLNYDRLHDNVGDDYKDEDDCRPQQQRRHQEHDYVVDKLEYHEREQGRGEEQNRGRAQELERKRQEELRDAIFKALSTSPRLV